MWAVCDGNPSFKLPGHPGILPSFRERQGTTRVLLNAFALVTYDGRTVSRFPHSFQSYT